MWVSWPAASLWPGNLEMQMVWPHSRPTEWEALGGKTQHFNKPPVILMLPGSNLKTITSFNASQVFQCKQITEGSFWNADPNSASLGWRWVCSSRRSQVMPTLLVLEPHTKKVQQSIYMQPTAFHPHPGRIENWGHLFLPENPTPLTVPKLNQGYSHHTPASDWLLVSNLTRQVNPPSDCWHTFLAMRLGRNSRKSNSSRLYKEPSESVAVYSFLYNL